MRSCTTRYGLFALPLLLAACGDAGDPAAEASAGPPVVTEEVAELSTGELLGLGRENVAAFTPWRAGTVTRTASDVAPTSRQVGVEALTADGFDRVVLGFRTAAPAPGYGVSPAGSDPMMLCGEETTFEESGVVVRLTPATIRDDAGETTLDATEIDLGLPVLESARVVCEAEREVVWFLATTPEAVEVRVLNLVSPERIAIDVRPGDTGPR